MSQLVSRAVVTTVVASSLVYVTTLVSICAFDAWLCVYGGAKNRGWV